MKTAFSTAVVATMLTFLMNVDAWANFAGFLSVAISVFWAFNVASQVGERNILQNIFMVIPIFIFVFLFLSIFLSVCDKDEGFRCFGFVIDIGFYIITTISIYLTSLRGERGRKAKK